MTLAIFNLGPLELLVLSLCCCIMPLLFGGGGVALGYFLAKRRQGPQGFPVVEKKDTTPR